MRSFRDFIEARQSKPERYKLKPGPLPQRPPTDISHLEIPNIAKTSDPTVARETSSEKKKLLKTLTRIRYKERTGMPFIEMVLFGIKQLVDDLPIPTIWNKLKFGEYYDNPRLQRVLEKLVPDYGTITIPQLERIVKSISYTVPTSPDHKTNLGSMNGKITDDVVRKLIGKDSSQEWWH